MELPAGLYCPLSGKEKIVQKSKISRIQDRKGYEPTKLRQNRFIFIEETLKYFFYGVRVYHQMNSYDGAVSIRLHSSSCSYKVQSEAQSISIECRMQDSFSFSD